MTSSNRDQRCAATTKAGTRCQLDVVPGGAFCGRHAKTMGVTCEVPGCDAPAGDRRRGHPIHTELCRKHGADVYNFLLWLGAVREIRPLGGPDDNFDSARAYWEREGARGADEPR